MKRRWLGVLLMVWTLAMPLFVLAPKAAAAAPAPAPAPALHLYLAAPPAPADQNVECDTNGGFSWIICGVIHLLLGFVDWVRDTVITPFLEEKPLSGPPFDAEDVANGIPTIYGVWAAFRNVASVFFILIFFLVIIGTAAGFDNYTIKKVLPRVVAAAILIPFSWYICAIMIDAGNILGKGAVALLTGGTNPIIPVAHINYTSSLTVMLTGAEFIAAAALFAGAIWTFSAFTLISVGLVLLAAFMTLILRKILIIFLVVISPLAFIMWILPNTQRWYKLWFDNLLKLILMYPIVIMLFLIGRLFAAVTPGAFGGTGADAWIQHGVVPLVQILALYLPLAGILLAPRWAGQALNVGRGQITKLQNAAEKRVGKSSQMGQDAAAERVRKNLIRSRNMGTNTLGGRMARARAGYGGGFMGVGRGRNYQQLLRENEQWGKAAADTGKVEGNRQHSIQSPPETGDERVAALAQVEAERQAGERAGRRAVLDNLRDNPAAGNVGGVYDATRIAEGRRLADEHGKREGIIQGNFDNPQALADVAAASADVERKHQADMRGDVEGVLRGTAELDARDIAEGIRLGHIPPPPPATAPAAQQQAWREHAERVVNRQRAMNRASDASNTKREHEITEEGGVRSRLGMEATHHESAADLLSATTSEEREKIAQAKAMRAKRVSMDRLAPESNDDLVQSAEITAGRQLAAAKTARIQARNVAATRPHIDDAAVLRAANINARDQAGDEMAGITQALETEAAERRQYGAPLTTGQIVRSAELTARKAATDKKALQRQLLTAEAAGGHESVDQVLDAANIKALDSTTQEKAQRIQARTVRDQMNAEAARTGNANLAYNAANVMRAANVNAYNAEAEKAGNRVGALNYDDAPPADKATAVELAKSQATKAQGALGVAAGTAKGTNRATDAAQRRYLRQKGLADTAANRARANQDLVSLASQNAAIETQDAVGATMSQGKTRVKVDRLARQKAVNDKIVKNNNDYDEAMLEHAEATSRDELGEKAGTRLGEIKNLRETGETKGLAPDNAIKESLTGSSVRAEVARQAKTSARQAVATAVSTGAKPDLKKIAEGAAYDAGRQAKQEIRKYEGTAEAADAERNKLIDAEAAEQKKANPSFDKDAWIKSGKAREWADSSIVERAGEASAINQGIDTSHELGKDEGAVSGQATRIRKNIDKTKEFTGRDITEAEAKANLHNNAFSRTEREVYNSTTGEAADEAGIIDTRRSNMEALVADARADGTLPTGLDPKQEMEWAAHEIDEQGYNADYLAGSLKVAESFGGALGTGRTLQADVKKRVNEAVVAEAESKGTLPKELTEAEGGTAEERLAWAAKQALDPKKQAALYRQAHKAIAKESHRNARNAKAQATGEAIGTVKGAVETAAVALANEQRTVQKEFKADEDLYTDDGNLIKKDSMVAVGTVLAEASKHALPPSQQVSAGPAGQKEAADRIARQTVAAGIEKGIAAQAQKSGEVAALAEAQASGGTAAHAERLSASRQAELDKVARQNAEVLVQREFAPGTDSYESYTRALEGEQRVRREQQWNGLIDRAERMEEIDGIPGWDAATEGFNGQALKNVEPNLEDNVPKMIKLAHAAQKAGRKDVVMAVGRQLSKTTGATARMVDEIRTSSLEQGGFNGNIWYTVDEGAPDFTQMKEMWDLMTPGAKGADIKKPPTAVLAGVEEDVVAQMSAGEFRRTSDVFARAYGGPAPKGGKADKRYVTAAQESYEAARSAAASKGTTLSEDQSAWLQSEENGQAVWWAKEEQRRRDDELGPALAAATDDAERSTLEQRIAASKERQARYESVIRDGPKRQEKERSLFMGAMKGAIQGNLDNRKTFDQATVRQIAQSTIYSPEIYRGQTVRAKVKEKDAEGKEVEVEKDVDMMKWIQDWADKKVGTEWRDAAVAPTSKDGKAVREAAWAGVPV